jgi:hypothetical protein
MVARGMVVESPTKEISNNESTCVVWTVPPAKQGEPSTQRVFSFAEIS